MRAPHVLKIFYCLRTPFPDGEIHIQAYIEHKTEKKGSKRADRSIQNVQPTLAAVSAIRRFWGDQMPRGVERNAFVFFCAFGVLRAVRLELSDDYVHWSRLTPLEVTVLGLLPWAAM